jgi:hypothetical protein
MKKIKQSNVLKNGKPTKRWYENPDPGDEMIAKLLADPAVRLGFIKASLKDGVSPNEIKNQLQYFGLYK